MGIERQGWRTLIARVATSICGALLRRLGLGQITQGKKRSLILCPYFRPLTVIVASLTLYTPSVYPYTFDPSSLIGQDVYQGRFIYFANSYLPPGPQGTAKRFSSAMEICNEWMGIANAQKDTCYALSNPKAYWEWANRGACEYSYTKYKNKPGCDVGSFEGQTVISYAWAYQIECEPGDTFVVTNQNPYQILCVKKKNILDISCPVANPVHVAHGGKVLVESDYSTAGAHPLGFNRSFRSGAPVDIQSVSSWTYSFSRRLQVVNAADLKVVYIRLGDGSVRQYVLRGNVQVAAQAGDKNELKELKDSSGTRTGWQYKVFEDDSVETYNASGVLQSIRQRNGWTTTLTYSTSTTPVASYLTGTSTAQPSQLISVRNHFGRELKFIYNAQGRMVQLVPPGAVKDGTLNTAQSPIRYGYDAQGNLTTVTWQDGTVKRYHYEDTRFPNHLTGITDEAGVRTNNYSYDDQGRATLSERGGERYLFSYGGTTGYSGSQTYITAPDGSTRTYTFEAAGGVIRPSRVTAPCPLCGSTAASTVWGDGTAATGGANARGQKFKEVAHDGTVTFYIYDTRGRETERATFPASFAGSTTRPALGSAARVVSTQWHGTFNLPTRIAEPNKLTAYTYASNGNLTGQSVTATTDATGAARFSAARDMSQPIPSTGWSYNGQQLPVTIVERETPANSTTAGEVRRWALTYNASGDISTATNQLNLVASAAAYDAAGHLLSGVTTQGEPISLSYNLRGALATHVVNGSTANYVSDVRGNLTHVRRGDGQSIRYTYNAAGALTKIDYFPAGVYAADGSLTIDGGIYWTKLLAVDLASAMSMAILPAAYAQGLPLPRPGVSPPFAPPPAGLIDRDLEDAMPGMQSRTSGRTKPRVIEREECKCSNGYRLVYEPNPKHRQSRYRGPRGDIIAREPTDGNFALQNSVQVNEGRRVGYDPRNLELVVLPLTRKDDQRCIEFYHGWVADYISDLKGRDTVASAARRAGYPMPRFD